MISPIRSCENQKFKREFHSPLFTQPHWGLFESRLSCPLSGAFEGLKWHAKPGPGPRAGVPAGAGSEKSTVITGQSQRAPAGVAIPAPALHARLTPDERGRFPEDAIVSHSRTCPAAGCCTQVQQHWRREVTETAPASAKVSAAP